MQAIQFGEAELETFAEVKRVSGVVEHFKVVNGFHTQITEAEYREAIQ